MWVALAVAVALLGGAAVLLFAGKKWGESKYEERMRLYAKVAEERDAHDQATSDWSSSGGAASRMHDDSE